MFTLRTYQQRTTFLNQFPDQECWRGKNAEITIHRRTGHKRRRRNNEEIREGNGALEGGRGPNRHPTKFVAYDRGLLLPRYLQELVSRD